MDTNDECQWGDDFEEDAVSEYRDTLGNLKVTPPNETDSTLKKVSFQ
jgi:hypothetical protein